MAQYTCTLPVVYIYVQPFEQIAEVDRPSGLMEPLLCTYVVEICLKFLPLLRREQHHHTRNAAVPVKPLLDMLDVMQRVLPLFTRILYIQRPSTIG